MNRTYTPEEDPAVLQRLAEFAASFTEDFPRKEQARWTEVYLAGLLQDGERKSIEPMMGRVVLPERCRTRDPLQAVRHFVGHGHWDHEVVLCRYRALMASLFASPDGLFVIDDTGFPKQGKHSVGVQRQYCGAAGKKTNCQVAVSVHYVAPAAHFPAAIRLYLPETWTQDEARLDEAKVPPDHRKFKTKIQIALELLDQARAEGLAGKGVITDAGYGTSQDFREGVTSRGMFYVAGLKGDEVAFSEEPQWIVPEKRFRRGNTPTRPVLSPASPKPMPVKELVAGMKFTTRRWREGTKGKLAAQFAFRRVWMAHRWTEGECAGEQPVWLIAEKRTNETKYAICNLPEITAQIKLVRLLKSRWPVEQGYQQMKEELGLDHFEGRRWIGFHHHATLVCLAYGFLLLERERIRAARRKSRKPREKNSAATSDDSRGPSSASEALHTASTERDPDPSGVSQVPLARDSTSPKDLTE